MGDRDPSSVSQPHALSAGSLFHRYQLPFRWVPSSAYQSPDSTRAFLFSVAKNSIVQAILRTLTQSSFAPLYRLSPTCTRSRKYQSNRAMQLSMRAIVRHLASSPTPFCDLYAPTSTPVALQARSQSRSSILRPRSSAPFVRSNDIQGRISPSQIIYGLAVQVRAPITLRTFRCVLLHY